MPHYTVADFIIERLQEWNVKRIFGYSGDAINPVVCALNKDDATIKFIQGRHEEMCAFMACAHAKFTGEIGVCLATSGPGAIHLLNGLYDAKMDNQPVLAIVGQQSRKALGTSFIQDVDLTSLFKDVAHEYVNVATNAEQVRHLIDRSIITALSKRTVTCLILPHDVQTAEMRSEAKRDHGQSFSGICYPNTAVVPPQSEIQKAADIINAASKPAILVGAGALKAREQIKALAEKTGAGVAKALLGKAAIEDSLPYVTGAIGLLGTEASSKMMQNCDAFLMIGSNFPYAEFLPQAGAARGIQIDLEPANISLRYPMEVGLIGDSVNTLKALLPLLHEKADPQWRDQIMKWVKESEDELADRAIAPGTPVNPERVFANLSTHLPGDSIITCDSGTSTVWFARHLKMRPGMMASVSGGLASMGCSLPYAVAAKFAFPGRPVIACSGDGAMQMAGINELITISKYWREWADPRLIIVVLKNNDLNFVTWEMRDTEGAPRFAAAQDVPDFSYAFYASSLGLEGLKIDSPELVESTLTKAFSMDRPVLVEVLSDPDIAPSPPSVSVQKEGLLSMALAQETVSGGTPILESLKMAWHSLTQK